MRKLSELGISPAPWSFGRPSKTHDAWIYCDDRPRGGAKKSNMFFVHYPYVGMMDEKRVRREQTANARLIAAAPKLYDRAQRLVSAFDRREMKPEHVEALRAALAEAAGEEVDDGKAT